MNNKKINTINSERPFDFSELFFSTTNHSGHITSWNEVFQRVSGYSAEDLSQKPHSLIRHPDMPRGVFKLLWTMIEKGETVGAYVKNRAIDGSYYWVYALVQPIPEGYLSIRLKPSSQYFELIQGLYAVLLQEEEKLISQNVPKAKVAEISCERILTEVSKLGIPNYQAFMAETFPTEMLQRDKKVAAKKYAEKTETEEVQKAPQTTIEQDNIASMASKLDSIFQVLKDASEFSKTIEGSFKGIRSLMNNIKRGSLNATIEASRLGEKGQTLFVLANYLSTAGDTTVEEVGNASKTFHKSIAIISNILFLTCSARLQTETLISFLAEVTQKGGSAPHSNLMSVDRLATLNSTFAKSITTLVDQYQQICKAFEDIVGTLDELRKLFIGLNIAHISAQAESARVDGASRFGEIFTEVCASVTDSKLQIEQVTASMQQYLSKLNVRRITCLELGEEVKKMSQPHNE